jgi:spore germination cell wall hydrolase CwlJ-like protein
MPSEPSPGPNDGCLMTGMNFRRLAFAVALASVPCGAPILSPATAADTATAEVLRVMSREHAALDSKGAARLTELSRSLRPRARADNVADNVTVASRNAASGAAAKADAVRRLDFAALDAMPRASGDAQWECLAEAIYFESRGEPIEGQVAVAEVVLNRVDDRQFPKTICGVTNQGAGSGRGCQFSYACDGLSDTMKSPDARERSGKLAKMMLDGRPRALTDGATYFHTRAVRPDWSRRFTRTAAIGHHLFYRAGTRVAAR